MDEMLNQLAANASAAGGFDWTYILVALGALLSMWASNKVKSAYSEFAGVRASCGLSGADVARKILSRNAISDVSVNHVAGELTDHYDPSRRVVNLSDAVYDSTSLAAIGVAAHECGHVLQHYTGYAPLKIRTALVPAANIGSKLGIPIILASLALGLSPIFAQVGVWLFSLGILFQIVTLPVEFDASRRALIMLEEYGILQRGEVAGSKKVLSAAAMTYVAAAVSAVAQLIRLIIIAKSQSRR